MAEVSFTLFETPIGPCAIAWNARGLVAVQLPEGDRIHTRVRLLRRQPGAKEATPPPQVQDAIAAIGALLRGDTRDLLEIALDETGVGDFERQVYALARTIPPGSTLTYGEVAARVGDPGAAQAVGQAMGRNPWPIVVPCHRVVGAGGKLVGFSASGGVNTKLKLLDIEGGMTKGLPLFDA